MKVSSSRDPLAYSREPRIEAEAGADRRASAAGRLLFLGFRRQRDRPAGMRLGGGKGEEGRFRARGGRQAGRQADETRSPCFEFI